jgi:hypothetical protein
MLNRLKQVATERDRVIVEQRARDETPSLPPAGSGEAAA